MRKRIIHIVVWLILTYLLLISMLFFLPVRIALFRSLAGILLFAGMFYSSGELLTTWFLIRKKQTAVFVLLAITLVILFSVLRVELLRIFPGVFTRIARQINPGELALENMLHPGTRARILSIIGTGKAPYFISVVLNIVILLFAVLLKLYENKVKKEAESREQLRKNQEAQIYYLKSQVNPHFLFNTLNNLYGLAWSKSDLAPQMVLGLSNTMRYMIYETEQKLVPLEKELNFISNYIELEKIRIPYPGNILFSVNISNRAVFIPPLLLLPFIENSFKHGNIGRDEDGWIEIDISDDNKQLMFICKNSISPENKKTTKPGIGLENVKKRLQLIFGSQFDLGISESPGEYLVSLQFNVFNRKDDL